MTNATTVITLDAIPTTRSELEDIYTANGVNMRGYDREGNIAIVRWNGEDYRNYRASVGQY